MPSQLGKSRELIADCVSWPNQLWLRNRVRPMAKMLIATPLTTWSTLNVTVTSAWMSPMSMPEITATSSPIQMLWNVMAPQTSVRAVTVMIPSRAMLTTPPRSEKTPPRAAKAMGEEISSPLTRKKVTNEKSISPPPSSAALARRAPSLR